MFKCKLCGDTFKNPEDLYLHMSENHSDIIPKDFSSSQYHYFLKTGKETGRCVICKKSTLWNEISNKYNRFCENPKCKEKYKEEFRKRMIGKYGKMHLLNDPNKQKEMLANRSISGKYKWSDGSKEITYTGSYEKEFLHFLDVFMNFSSDEVISPSPHVYYYEYEGEKKFYIPDFYLPNFNLEIEVKDGGDNPNNHGKIQEVDKKKEELKDAVLTSQKEFSYIKIINKKYESFFSFLFEFKKRVLSNNNTPIFITDYNSGYKSIRESVEIYNNENLEVVNEFSMGGKVKLYHAALGKFDILQPLGFDLGNAFQKPGWSLFCWKNKNSAINWAVFQRIAYIKNYYKKNNNPAMDNVRFIWNTFTEKLAIVNIGKDAVINYCTNSTAYVYTIITDLNNVGLGNTATHKEYTLKYNNISYDKCERVILTPAIIEKHVDFISEDDARVLYDRVTGKHGFMNRGIISYFMTNEYLDNFSNDVITTISNGLSSGELRPGDDIEEYLKSKNKNIKSMGIIDRTISVISAFLFKPEQKPSNNKINIKEDIRTPEKLNNMLKGFDYGILTRDKKRITEIKDGNMFYKHYSSITPQDFYRYRIGVCWDYVEFERYMFLNYYRHLSFKTYYIELDNESQSTHTFLVYKYNNKYYYFESAYYNLQGVHEFNTIEEIFNFILKNMFKDEGKQYKYKIYEYYFMDTFNKSSIEYMNYIKNTGKRINYNYIDNVMENCSIDLYNKNIDEYILTESNINTDENKIPIYVFLSHTGTKLSNAIVKLTKDPYAHASLSLDSSMHNMYSFGRKYKDHPFLATFVKEDIDDGLFKDVKDTGKFSVYTTFVTKKQYDELQKQIKYFSDHVDKMRYNLIGLLTNFFNIEFERENTFFCSEFVAHVLQAIDYNLVNKSASLIKPYDFTKNKKFHFVTKGKLKNFDESKIIEKVNKLKEEI